MSESSEKLLVSWKGPKTKKNYFVGVLSKSDHAYEVNYKFFYNKEVVLQAEEEGFRPFVGLKDLNKEYYSEKLFSVFERRLPNQNRHIFKKIIHDYQLQNSDDVTWEYLKITKGRTATDNLSFLEPVYMDHDKLIYIGEIAGWSYTKSNNSHLEVNAPLVLRNDENNTDDTEAVEVINSNNGNARVGYIPKPFNKVFNTLLKKDYFLSGYVRSIDSYDGRPTIAVEKRVFRKDIDAKLNYLIHMKS
ncbi:HIRAN domain-containing protein [Oceanobacillus locisalsi]|uniref:HIRAN domain-containing protein n=1 Tax=Oceanobacillus locisalsi TaxID=546107 RepID=A0ABW3NBB0_9BACI